MTHIVFASVCSGIEAASVAWHPLGWRAAWFSEIDPFASAVLAHHYPTVPNLGDMTKFESWPDEPIDLLCGGTPCQSFSVAGLRKGLDDPRGDLMLTFGAVAAKYRPTWLVWENVPGVLSSNTGRDFGAFLGMLGQLGYGFAYRVFDAQYFGVAQRRRRVFVVGHSGGCWQRAAAVLFERRGMSRHPAPRDQARQVAAAIPARRFAGGRLGNDFDCDGGLIASGNAEDSTGLPFLTRSNIGKTINNQTPLLAIAFPANLSGTQCASTPNLAPSLGAKNPTAVAFESACASPAMQVRRLTPTECERLQGLPDGYTAIAWRGKPAEQCPDGPRYKALGNAWAVPVARWIGERIERIERMNQDPKVN